ncbi:RNA-directed DNA polymerase, eukaryota, reverse transcriptase zinc-binding domain protein [Tanacetum coccineum]
MVNNRTLFVQKWDPEIGVQKVEPITLPLWVKLMNIPIEAWRMEGISAMASSLGKPMVMDYVIANMREFGVGRSNYDRVLVEIDAKKEIKEEIKIKYTDKGNCVKGTKDVKVMYDWKPECCPHFYVFGHCYKKCKVRPGTEEEIKAKEEAMNKAKKSNEIEEGFTEVQNRKKNLQQQ